MGYRLFSLDGVPIIGPLETDEVYAIPAMVKYRVLTRGKQRMGR